MAMAAVAEVQAFGLLERRMILSIASDDLEPGETRQVMAPTPSSVVLAS